MSDIDSPPFPARISRPVWRWLAVAAVGLVICGFAFRHVSQRPTRFYEQGMSLLQTARNDAAREDAFNLLLQAAQAGLPEAEAEVARCYEEGLGVEKDVEEAFAWASRSALTPGIGSSLAA